MTSLRDLGPLEVQNEVTEWKFTLSGGQQTRAAARVEAPVEAVTQFFRTPWMDLIMDAPEADVPGADFPELGAPEAEPSVVAAGAV